MYQTWATPLLGGAVSLSPGQGGAGSEHVQLAEMGAWKPPLNRADKKTYRLMSFPYR